MIAPDASSAAKALPVEEMLTKPLPLGAPVPPYDERPHAVIAPDASSAAKAWRVEEMLTNPLPLGAPLPP